MSIREANAEDIELIANLYVMNWRKHMWICYHLDSLHVFETSRGKGVGIKLINTVGNYAYIKGYEDMSICIVKGNDKAKRIYVFKLICLSS